MPLILPSRGVVGGVTVASGRLHFMAFMRCLRKRYWDGGELQTGDGGAGVEKANFGHFKVVLCQSFIHYIMTCAKKYSI